MKKVCLQEDMGKWKKGYCLAFPDSVAAELAASGKGVIMPDDVGLKKTGSENYVNCAPMSQKKAAYKAAQRLARLSAPPVLEPEENDQTQTAEPESAEAVNSNE